MVHGIKIFVFNDKAVKKMKLHTVEKNTQLTPQTSQDAIECELWTLGKVDKTSMIPLDNSFE